MKVLRRSLHKEKDRLVSPSRQSFASSQPPTQPFASLAPHLPGPNPRGLSGPPTMVIRAITSYKAKRIVEISFQKGDFFHVVGEREDAEGEWFEASNPATRARGLVPKFAFEMLGKNSKDQSAPATTPRLSNFGQNVARMSQTAHSPANGPPSAGAPNSAGGQKSQPLYGVVQHDFVAERPDELDAKRGEPIIVIAQSNHEWFVAKPIGRLGGPGLIPVSFVEVQDVTTGKALPPDRVKELIRSAVVPKVEEWKKATAAYKGNSIPLGRFDFPCESPSTSGTSQPPQSAKPFANEDQSRARSSRSPSISHSRQQSSAMAPTQSGRSQQTGSWHGRTGSASQPSAQHSREHSSSLSAHPSFASAWPSSTYPSSQSPHLPEQYDPEREPGPAGEGDGYATVEELRERYGVVVHASVESFHYEQGHFWFHLRAHFSRQTEDGEMGDDTTVLVLYRLYEDFYDFQAALMDAFPNEAGQDNARRILPAMPGPQEHVDELVCAQRVEDLSVYLAELCALPSYIRECELVYEFLGPREGDVELEGDPGGPVTGRSQQEVEGEVVEYLSRMDQAQEPELDQLMGRLSTRESYQEPSRHQRESSHASYKHDSLNSQPRAGADPRTHSYSTSSSTGLSPAYHHHLSGSSDSPRPAPAFLRIKIYQRQTDDLIAIRAPNDVRYDGLLQRVRERMGEEVMTMRYRDETGTGYATGATVPLPAPNGARLVGIDNDDDLDRWLESGSRLVLYVD